MKLKRSLRGTIPYFAVGKFLRTEALGLLWAPISSLSPPFDPPEDFDFMADKAAFNQHG